MQSVPGPFQSAPAAVASAGARATADGVGTTLPAVDGAAIGSALCWREYSEHVERLLDLGIGTAEATPFEEERALSADDAVPHVWRIIGFSVRRVPCERSQPLKLHTTDAYIILLPKDQDGAGGRSAGSGGAGSGSGRINLDLG